MSIFSKASKAEDLFIGIDVGTTGIKAAAYDISGKICGSAAMDNETISTRPGWSSQSMERTWEITLDVLRKLSHQIDAAATKSIGVCAQGDGLWLLDEDKRSFRNAILWNDQRASDYVQSWIEDGTSTKLARHARTAIWPGTSGAAYRWLQENEPENAKRARYAINCKDWITFRLTGELTTDFTDATIPFLDIESGQYATEAFELLGVADLEHKLLQPRRSFEKNGYLNETVAHEIGIPSQIPVAVGGLDVATMAFGMGLQETGDAFVILGTTAIAGIISEPQPFAGQPVGATVCDVNNESWLRVLAPLCGASALDWFVKQGFTHSGHNMDIEDALEIASQSPPGSNGVTFLPFLNGERAPFVAPDAKASFAGISGSTTNADMARSVLEGVAFSLRHCFESINQEMPKTVFLTGGGAQSRLWCEVLANVLNSSVIVSHESNHGSWGAAQLGAIAADIQNFPLERQSKENINCIEPNEDTAIFYDQDYKTYKRVLDCMSSLW